MKFGFFDPTLKKKKNDPSLTKPSPIKNRPAFTIPKLRQYKIVNFLINLEVKK